MPVPPSARQLRMPSCKSQQNEDCFLIQMCKRGRKKSSLASLGAELLLRLVGWPGALEPPYHGFLQLLQLFYSESVQPLFEGEAFQPLFEGQSLKSLLNRESFQ